MFTTLTHTLSKPKLLKITLSYQRFARGSCLRPAERVRKKQHYFRFCYIFVKLWRDLFTQKKKYKLRLESLFITMLVSVYIRSVGSVLNKKKIKKKKQHR